MTLRLTFGVDPGLSGAIATLLDGVPGPVLDMPTRAATKTTNREEVDETAIAEWVRARVREHCPGAYVSACIELVGATPIASQGERRQGTTSMFNFGDGAGVLRAVFGTLRIPYVRVQPRQWKRMFRLGGEPKDASRLLALERFPTAAPLLQRKKDGGRAEALLIAQWHDNSQTGVRAA